MDVNHNYRADDALGKVQARVCFLVLYVFQVVYILQKGVYVQPPSLTHHGIIPSQLSTLCVKHGLVAAGGFNGEVVVKRLNDPDLLLR